MSSFRNVTRSSKSLLALGTSLLAVIVVASCSEGSGGPATKAASISKPRYFGSFAGYSIPFKPTEPLTAEEATSRASYYVGRYDAHERLASFAKYLDGKRFFLSEYTYDQHGTFTKQKTTTQDGEVIEEWYNKRGNRTKRVATKPNGQVIEESFGERGVLTKYKKTMPDGHVIEVPYTDKKTESKPGRG